MQAKDVRKLFRFIDWIMILPPPLSRIFWTEVERIQEERRMPFITTPERLGIASGLKRGIREFLTFRFGADAEAILTEIEDNYDHELLERVMEAIGTIDHPNNLRALWATNPPEAGDAAPTS